jgi:hypothetical protein
MRKTLNTSVRSTKNGAVYLDSGLMTATGGRFQATPIDNANVPPHVLDQTLFLQRACRCIDRRSSNPEHLREELLRKWKAILTCMVWVINSHRAQRFSIVCNRLHAAPMSTCRISAKRCRCITSCTRSRLLATFRKV